jgi:hypothetical protein
MVQSSFRRHLSYSNVVATAALFIALGGTSYAVLRVDSRDVVNNSLRSSDVRNDSLRSRDIRDRTLRARDLRLDALGGGVVKEGALGQVPRATDADRVGGLTAEELRIRCPSDTVAKAGVCVEQSARSPASFLGASSTCDNAGRGLPTMPELDRFARSHGPLAPGGEWTASVYLYAAGGPTFDELEALVLSGGGDVGRDRVNAPIQHPYRCVALPSN